MTKILSELNSSWLSIQEIAEKLSIPSKDIVQQINSLSEQEMVRTRVSQGKIQYSLVEKDYQTLDEFMLKEIPSVPKDKSYSSEELVDILLEKHPESPWGRADISNNLPKFVRIGSLGAMLGMNGNNSEHHYAVL
jgi:predicted ArsR family transcriptional regulator